ncbi:DUF6659 family protein [Candidatus Nitrosocosmicus franklandus]|uniref:Roadblock/LAMTOR2 domain-containing protein n=1 Tax=Candidatus Nitrosocosmicus franklandianus TaxID=1798806 RepID=A0A484I949_9ARCH|nr:DUF6659 family protein [Candidatus Nitrosocosmicus franklandus]VFJ12774.1 conserved protein of unknown function [Candidatus Nitrosocosmicus franklandus]
MPKGNNISNSIKINLSEEIFALDGNIRFVGLVNKEGEVIEGGFRKGIEPLLNQNEEQDMYLQSLSNINFFQSFSEKFGRLDYLVIRLERITMMTFPLNDKILCISTSSQSNTDKIRYEIINLLKNDKSIK